MSKWKDVSSWGQSATEKDGSVPTAWEMQISDLRIVVTRHIHYSPDAWVLRTWPEILRTRVAGYRDVADAKAEAVSLLRKKLKELLQELDEYHAEKGGEDGNTR